MEPTRPTVRAIMALRRAAHLNRYADAGLITSDEGYGGVPAGPGQSRTGS